MYFSFDRIEREIWCTPHTLRRPQSDLLPLNCLPLLLTAVSRSSALKINTRRRITFSVTISITALGPWLSRSSQCIHCINLLACMFGLREKSHTLAPAAQEWKLKEGLEAGWSAANNTPIKCNRTKAEWQCIITNATAEEKHTKECTIGLRNP